MPDLAHLGVPALDLVSEFVAKAADLLLLVVERVADRVELLGEELSLRLPLEPLLGHRLFDLVPDGPDLFGHGHRGRH